MTDKNLIEEQAEKMYDNHYKKLPIWERFCFTDITIQNLYREKAKKFLETQDQKNKP